MTGKQTVEKLNRQAVILLCQQLDMFSDSEIAIDGSKFKAVNSRDKNFTDRKLKARIEQLEENIARYLEELDRADRQPTLVPQVRVKHIKEKIASLKCQIEGFNALEKQLQTSDRAEQDWHRA